MEKRIPIAIVVHIAQADEHAARDPEVTYTDNISGGGMAVRTAKPLKHGAVLNFTFELSLGVRLSGKGQVAWVSSEGMAGIIMQALRGKGNDQLDGWLAVREQLGSKGAGTEA